MAAYVTYSFININQNHRFKSTGLYNLHRITMTTFEAVYERFFERWSITDTAHILSS